MSAAFFNVGTIIQHLQRLHPEVNERFPWDDVGASALFAELTEGCVKYAADRKAWFCFDGVRWALDAGSVAVDEKLKLVARALQAYAQQLDAPMIQPAYVAFARRWSQRRTRDTILRDARSICPVKSDEFDRDIWSLNVRNGLIDLRTGELRPHRPEDMVSRIAPVEFQPEVRCDRWEWFIREISNGDDDLAAFLQRMAGYSLTGSTTEESAFILFGESSRNGKTTFAVTLQSLLSEYAATADPVTLAAKKFQSASGPSEDVARLEGRRLVVLPEPDEEMQFSPSRLKSLTGGDVVVARRPYEPSIEYRPQFKLLFAANSLPRCADPAVFRSNRLWVIPFTRSFAPSEQDRTLKSFFAQPQNLTGILSWAVEGVQRYLEEGLNPPAAVLEATSNYAERESSRPLPEGLPVGCYGADNVFSFIENVFEPDPTAELRSSDAYDDYRRWCADNDLPPSSQTKFGLELKRFVPVARKRPRTGGEKASIISGYRLKC